MNIWPINAATDDQFMAAQLLFSVLAFLGAAAAQKLVAQWVDPRQPGAVGGPAGGVLPAVATTIAEGSLPRGDDALLVAAARGPDRLAAALLAAAHAEGWLVQVEPSMFGGRWRVLRDAQPSLRALAPLQQELGRFPKPIDAHTCLESAKRVAIEKLLPRMRPELERLGLRRTFGARALIATPPIVAMVGLLELASARWQHTAIDDSGVGFVMFIGALACVLLAVNPDRRTVAWNRYLGWLWESTQALRDDVVDGRRKEPDEVALTAALEGITGAHATVPYFMPRTGMARNMTQLHESVATRR